MHLDDVGRRVDVQGDWGIELRAAEGRESQGGRRSRPRFESSCVEALRGAEKGEGVGEVKVERQSRSMALENAQSMGAPLSGNTTCEYFGISIPVGNHQV